MRQIQGSSLFQKMHDKGSSGSVKMVVIELSSLVPLHPHQASTGWWRDCFDAKAEGRVPQSEEVAGGQQREQM